MEKITAFFESIDLTKLVPELDTLLGKVQTITTLALLIGPILMLIFGLWFFFLPPKEANHRAGFRTWFGMGSVEAWRFTQRLAGVTWGGLGLILTIIMVIVSLTFGGKDIMGIANTAFICLIWQAGLALVSYLVICFIVMLCFDSKGLLRKNK